MIYLYNFGLETIFIYALAAILPALLLIIYIYRHDKVEKEPLGLLFKLFLCGVISAVPAIILELIADEVIIVEMNIHTQFEYGVISALFVGLIEEGCKFFFLYRKTWKNKNFNYTFDGIVYAVTISLGFAAIENVIYVFSYGLSLALTRALTAIPGHMCFAVFMGYFYSLAKKYRIRKKNKFLFLSYFAAVTLHTIYDAILLVDSEISSVVFMVFIIAMYLVVYKKIKQASRNDAYMI